MGVFTRAISTKVKLLGKVQWSGLTAQLIKVLFMKEKNMVKALIFLPYKINMLVNGT